MPDLKSVRDRLYLDGCTDLVRGVSVLSHNLLNGMPYAEALAIWKAALPELFDVRLARKRQREQAKQEDSRMVESPPAAAYSEQRSRGYERFRRRYG